MDSAGQKPYVTDYLSISDYVLFYGDKVYEGNEFSDNARGPVRYLIQSLKHQPLMFQNFVLGDSVNGMLLIQPRLSYHYVSSGILKKIGHYKSEKIYKTKPGGYLIDEPIADSSPKVQMNIYRFELKQVYYGKDVIGAGPVYILSDSSLITNEERILVFQHETPNPFYFYVEGNGPAVCVPVRQLNMPCEGDTVIVPSGPNPNEFKEIGSRGGYGAEKKWIKLFWGLMRIQVKSDLAKAYKRQILKDWDKFHEENEN